MADEGIDRYQFGNWPVSPRYSCNTLHITSDKYIARADRVDLRPHDDGIAPLFYEQIDGDSALTAIRETDLHVTPPSPPRLNMSYCLVRS